MGCTPSRPTGVEPDHVAGGAVGPAAISSSMTNGGRQPPPRQDSGRSNASSKRMAGQRRRGSNASNTAAAATNGSNNNNSRHDASYHHHLAQNGVGTITIVPTSDPRWIHLWKTHQDLLLDPADVHATMEASMARITNKLTVTEITFLQRKVRSIVRASNQFPEIKGTRMPSLLRSSSANSNVTQDQEIKTIAEKFHLLSSHVVRKILPNLPEPAVAATTAAYYEETNNTSTMNGMSNHSSHNGGSVSNNNINRNLVADNAFQLCLFLHESLWDRVATIAASSAKEAGVETDVNKYKLPEDTPVPVAPVAADVPEVPAGISLHSLSFLIGLALRKLFLKR